MNIIIVVLCILLVAVAVRNTENMDILPSKSTYQRSCNNSMSKTLSYVINKNNMKKVANGGSVIMPCGYNNIKKEVNALHSLNPSDKIFILSNSDNISSKNLLWKNLRDTYGLDKAKTMMPNTYILTDKKEMRRFLDEYNESTIYIMKKNIQRQKGLFITRDKNKILKGAKKQYVVVQELLQDPYLIDGRKINLRFYLLILRQDKEMIAYVHNNGFMYYTVDKFVKNSTKDGPNITTGYIDRKVYEENPLTHQDFRKYLDKPRPLTLAEKSIVNSGRLLSEEVFQRINDLIAEACIAVENKITSQKKFQDRYTFQLFGVDISISDKLKPMIMEINKGPDLSGKDERDLSVKHKVIEDMFKCIKVIDDKNNGFIKIL